MSDIPPIKAAASSRGLTPQPKAPRGPGAPADSAQPGGPLDRIEISEMGQLLSTLEPDADVRVEKVAEIRRAIANGTYETEAKLEYTVSRLLEVLRSGE